MLVGDGIMAKFQHGILSSMLSTQWDFLMPWASKKPTTPAGDKVMVRPTHVHSILLQKKMASGPLVVQTTNLSIIRSTSLHQPWPGKEGKGYCSIMVLWYCGIVVLYVNRWVVLSALPTQGLNE